MLAVRLPRLASALALAGILLTGGASSHALDDVSVGLGQDALRIIGRDPADEAGAAVAAGDVSGDGVADILVGAPQSGSLDNSRPKGGEVGLVLGAVGLVDVPQTFEFRRADRTFYGATSSARLGSAVAIGDIDGDGVGDMIMGAPEADAPGAGEGAAYVFYGGARLTDEDRFDLAAKRADLVIWGGETGARLGKALAVGDFNGDGVDDIAVSGPGEGDRFNRHDAGVVYVFFGRRNLERGLEVFPGVFLLMTIRGPIVSGGAGSALGAGDVNQDGIDDLVIGVPMTGPMKDIAPGAVYVVFGGPTLGPSQPVRDLGEASQVDLRLSGPLPGDRFGLAVGTGDINGGALDLLLGAPGSSLLGGGRPGRAYAIFGRPFQRGTVIDIAADGADVSLVGPHDGAELGASIGAADLTGDGLDEWIIGAPGADRTGQVYRILGRNVWSELGVSAALTQGQRPGDRAGTSVATGDVNGDGTSDLVFGSPSFDGLLVDKPESGAAYLISGREGDNTPGPDCVDGDGDGYRGQGRTCGPTDCDDTNPNTHPFAAELCGDGIDNDCDGNVDGSGVDADGDGYVAPPAFSCGIADCNDRDAAVHPNATESCSNGIDDNCDDKIDGGDRQCVTGFAIEECSNCVDDDGNGRNDLLEDVCPANTITIDTLSARRAGRRGTAAKRLTAKGVLLDPPFLRDFVPTVTVGLAFEDGQQVCVSLAAGNPTRRGAVTFTSTDGTRTVLRLVPRKGGRVLFTIDHRAALGLPVADPMRLRVGLYADGAVYRGAAELHAKGQLLVSGR